MNRFLNAISAFAIFSLVLLVPTNGYSGEHSFGLERHKRSAAKGGGLVGGLVNTDSTVGHVVYGADKEIGEIYFATLYYTLYIDNNCYKFVTILSQYFYNIFTDIFTRFTIIVITL